MCVEISEWGGGDEVLAGLSCQLEIIMHFLHLVRLKGP